MNASLSVYLSSDAAIVAAHAANQNGMYCEQDSPAVLAPFTAATLGAAIKAGFAAFAFSVPSRPMGNTEKPVWPAFLASGCRSASRFEQKFRCATVMYLNPAGIAARVEMAIRGKEEFAVSATFNPRASDEEIGRKVLGVFALAGGLGP